MPRVSVRFSQSNQVNMPIYRKRELVFKEDGQEYAQVFRMLVNGRCQAVCDDGRNRICQFTGQMHKEVCIDDIILVSLRVNEDDKADVILKYTPEEVRLLKACGELPYGELRENVWFDVGYASNYLDKEDDDDDNAGDDNIWFNEGFAGSRDEEDDDENNRINEGIAGGLDEEDDDDNADNSESEDEDIYRI